VRNLILIIGFTIRPNYPLVKLSEESPFSFFPAFTFDAELFYSINIFEFFRYRGSFP